MPTSLKGSKYYGGWIRDALDARDQLFAYRHFRPGKRIEDLPEQVRLPMPRIGDQSTLGSCTGWGIGKTASATYMKNRGVDHDIEFSALMLYYLEREIEKSIDYDAGAQIRDGIKAFAKTGCCFDINWPYEIAKFRQKPEFGCYVQASQFRITQYHRIDHTDLAEILECLADGFPVVFGFAVYESFEWPATMKTGFVQMPDVWHERLLGGHCMYLIGYDRKEEIFVSPNSWGEGVGDKGVFYFPFNYLTDRRLAADFWTIRAGTNFEAV